MKQSEAWVLQVESDFAAAERVFVTEDPSTYCQAIAKYQQSVEKSVKAMVAAVNDLGIQFTSVTPSHLPTDEIGALLRLRRAIDNASVDSLARMFARHRQGVENLCRLAPKWPEKGQRFPRNTEYPFQVDGTEWRAPAAVDSFTQMEVNNARKTAWAFHNNAIDFVHGVRRARV